jgi:hypothetical protein
MNKTIQMTTFGKNGRFGNQIFQYFFLELIRSKLGYAVNHPDWVAGRAFDLDERKYELIESHHVPMESPEPNRRRMDPERDIAALARFMADGKLDVLDISGYFQYHTYFLAKYKSEFLRIFKYTDNLMERISSVLSDTGMDGRSIIGIHVRQGDFNYTRNQHTYFWVNSNESVLRAVKDVIDSTLYSPIIYLASDEVDKVGAEFAAYQVPCITYKNIIHFVPDIDPMVIDHIMLILSNVLIISNSSFSFTAAMLNEKASIFLRPNPEVDNFIPFDPWNSDVLLKKKGYELQGV